MSADAPDRIWISNDGDAPGWELLQVPDPAGRAAVEPGVYTEYVRAGELGPDGRPDCGYCAERLRVNVGLLEENRQLREVKADLAVLVRERNDLHRKVCAAERRERSDEANFEDIATTFLRIHRDLERSREALEWIEGCFPDPGERVTYSGPTKTLDDIRARVCDALHGRGES